MPAAIAVPLIAAAASGATTVAAAKMGSNAANKASKTQANAATDALNFEKQQYANEQARLQPYRDLGGQAFAKIGQSFGLSAPTPQATAYGSGGNGGTFTFAQPQGGGMVKIRNPRTGEIRPVPAAQAKLLQARGGQVVA